VSEWESVVQPCASGSGNTREEKRREEKRREEKRREEREEEKRRERERKEKKRNSREKRGNEKKRREVRSEKEMKRREAVVLPCFYSSSLPLLSDRICSVSSTFLKRKKVFAFFLLTSLTTPFSLP
jgi:hypothetical protein